MLDIITTLDPRWLYPYLFGGVTLSLDLDRPDLANKLLRKAIPAHPLVWKIPFLIGFNAYFGMGDAGTAARYIEQASRLPGAPAYLGGFASRLYAKGGSREDALRILREVIEQTEDPVLRKRLVRRHRKIQAGSLDGPYKKPQEGEAP
jgi:tetratricopeptide (TPR) repeat protein